LARRRSFRRTCRGRRRNLPLISSEGFSRAVRPGRLGGPCRRTVAFSRRHSRRRRTIRGRRCGARLCAHAASGATCRRARRRSGSPCCIRERNSVGLASAVHFSETKNEIDKIKISAARASQACPVLAHKSPTAPAQRLQVDSNFGARIRESVHFLFPPPTPQATMALRPVGVRRRPG
jgi:hypothetical protein